MSDRRRWPRGEEGCTECGGEGRVRRQPLKKDGTPKRLARWEQCVCVGRHPKGCYNDHARPVVFFGAHLEAPVEYPPGFKRPTTRGSCEGGQRPCPLVGCRHNTYLEVTNGGRSIRVNYGQRGPEDVPPESSCALDLVDERPDGMTLEEVAVVLGCTRERVRQVEEDALVKLTKRCGGTTGQLREDLRDSMRIATQRVYTGKNWGET